MEAVVIQESWAVLAVVVSRPLFHPYQQGIENCGSLLLSDPLKFRWAEVLVRKFSEGRRGRPRSIGARAHTHLKGHLSLVCPLGFWVPESVKQKQEGSKASKAQ